METTNAVQLGTEEKRRDMLLDLFKYLLAFMVVCIHFGYKISGFDIRPICRLAVTMFFMISGFYSYDKNKEIACKKIGKSIRRTLKYVIIAYAIFALYNICFYFPNVGKMFKNFFGTNILYNYFFLNTLAINFTYHLWFLNALLIAYMIHYLFVRYNATKYYYVLVPILILVFIFPQYYTWIAKKTIDFGDSKLRRNAYFFGLPCLAVGYLLKSFIIDRNGEKLIKPIIYGALSIAFSVLIFFEAKKIGDFSFYLSSIFLSISLLLLFDYTYKRFAEKPLKKYQVKAYDWFYRYVGVNGPFVIYIVHVIIGELFKRYRPIGNFWLSVVVFVISFGIYEVLHIGDLLTKMLINKIKQSKAKQELSTHN